MKEYSIVKVLINFLISSTICFGCPVYIPKESLPSSFSGPVNWIKWNKNCYYFSTLEWSYDAALQKCDKASNENFTSKLVSIGNGEENVFLLQNLLYVSEKYKAYVSSTWIGLRKVPKSDFNYRWADGSIAVYVNWVPGAPSYFNSCINMLVNPNQPLYGMWKETTCSNNKASFICEATELVDTKGNIISNTFPSTQFSTKNISSIKKFDMPNLYRVDQG